MENNDLSQQLLIDNTSKKDNAYKMWKLLLVELSLRKDNFTAGPSKLGGNVSELFFILTHMIDVHSFNEEKVFVTEKESPYNRSPKHKRTEIVVYIPHNASMLDLRNTLSKFIQSHPDYQEITEENMLSIEWLNAWGTNKKQSSSSHMFHFKQLKTCIAEAELLKEFLKNKEELLKQISLSCAYENKAVLKKYAKSLNIAPSDVDERFLAKHSEYSLLLNDIKTRHLNMGKQILNQEEIHRLQFINTFDDHIKIFVIRNLIGIPMLVKFELDELLKQPEGL